MSGWAYEWRGSDRPLYIDDPGRANVIQRPVVRFKASQKQYLTAQSGILPSDTDRDGDKYTYFVVWRPLSSERQSGVLLESGSNQ